MSRLLLFLLVLQFMRGSLSDVLSLKDTATYRNRRNSDLVSSGDDELSEEICSLSLQRELFSSISLSINDEIADCSESSSIYDEYNITVNSPTSSFFTLSSTDKSVLFADHFDLETSYNVTVETLCVSCDVNVVELRLTLTMADYTQRLLPHGDTLSDNSLPVEDDGFVDVTFDSPFSIPVYDKRFQEAYISTNGLLTFESPQTNWYPEPFPYGSLGVPVLAPYWTDLNLTNSSIAAVYYNMYHRSSGNRAETILSLASGRINNFLDKDFVGQWVLVVTWLHVSPYSNSSTNKDITFQLLLVTDYTSTYTLYFYNDFNINELVSSLVIGHHAADLLTYHNVELTSSDSFLHMDTQTGNTGEQGQWIYDVSDGDNTLDQAETSCIEWAGQQTEASWADDLPSCPCTKQQATHDWRYSFDQSDRVNCAIYIPVTTQGTVECCYDGNELIGGSVEEGSSGYLRYHPVYSPDDYRSNDEEPYTDCCETSSNCEVFKLYRPSADCSRYTAPASCFAWGDPHFETFDGESYTFNGIGEFVLFSSISKDNLLVQIRLQKYLSTQASVITAVAVKYKDLPTIQLKIIDSKYQLYYDGVLQSDLLPTPGNMIAFTNDVIRYNDSLSKVDFENENYLVLRNINDTYIIVTSNGAAIRVGKELTFLHCTMEVSKDYYEDTKGLMGYYDNDPSNDYYLPNGTTLSTDLTENQLYSGFGLKWHVAKADSIFTYTNDETYEDYNSDSLTFTPNFGTDEFNDDPTLKAQAEEQCEGDYSCLYDTAQTGDLDVGLETHRIRNSNNELEQELDDYPPMISGSPFRLIVHKQDEYTAEYTARDPVTDETTVISIKDPVPTGVAINSTNNHLSLNLTTLPSNPLYLTTTDSNGTTSTQRVSILFCDCENNGSCIEDTSFTSVDSNGHYRLPCDCQTGFGGLYCEDDFRGCSNDPCASYSTCEDNSISDYGYKCVDCKTGYGYSNEEKCIDKNECLNGENDCSQQCINSDGDYKCSCQDGFRLGDDGLTCNDINECAELSDGCDQICTNTKGGYDCSCESTWDLSSDGYTCNVRKPYQCQDCDDDVKCSAVGESITCICPKGEQLLSNECHKCIDDKTGYDCQQNCTCLNGGTCGSTGCICTEGYTGYDCGTEINDYDPVFSSDTVHEMELPEALPKLSSIVYIKASDNDTGAAGEVTYSIVNTTYGLPHNVSNGVGVFTIGSTSGLLASAVPLAEPIERTFLLMIETKDGGVKPNKETHLLYISIVDKPLPQPLFSSNSYSEYIHENKTKGSIIVSDIECTEKDSISAGVVDLQISITTGNTNSSFKIVNNELTIGSSLDYEVVKRYDLDLSCTNAFNNTADTNVTIVVLNINDNPFEFDTLVYTIDVYENETKDYLLETFHASDADHPNLTVEYYLTDSGGHSDIFTLGSASGELSIGSVSPFDREKLDNYTLEVTAHLLNTDSSIKHTVATEVKITIKDINDYTPLFSKLLYVVTNLSQSNTKGETVTIVSASDEDLGSNAVIAYSIETNAQFDVNSTTGEVFISTGFLDKGTYTLSVYATDSGSPSLTGTSVIEVVVKATPDDIHFTQNKYVFNVSEDKAVGSSLGVAEAVLYDVANNSIDSQLAYSLVNSASLPFTVNTDNGEITVLSSFDYEEQDFYDFIITASYPSHPSVPTATTTVQVTISDINDNYPVFVPSTYSKLLYDDTAVDTTVLSVHASDKDEDGQQAVLYSLAGSYAPFEINSTNGAIVLKTELDLPLDYHFTVTATDTGQPSLSNQTTVHITVTRRSAIHPLLSSTKFIFTLPEALNTPAGNIVGTVNALIDGNVTVASEHGIGYRISYRDHLYLPVAIDMTSGVLTTLAHSFDYETQDKYIFHVELYDIDDGTVYDTAPVVVKLLDVNDESPVFDEAIYSSTIPSTTETGAVVLTVSASDSDSGNGGDILYSINPNNNGFHVDAFTGDITMVNSTVQAGQYELVVTATDQGNPPLSTSVNVHFTVTGSTQNITFTQDTYVFSVVEGSPINTEVESISVSAINGDTNVDYDDLLFEIFPKVDCISNNGRVVITGCSDLDREEQSVYNLTMKATHVSLVGVSGEVSVQVNIDDVNDNSPVFDKDVYPVIVSNDFNTSTILLSPVVADNDLNSATVFSIDTSNTDIFTIDSNTGDIKMSSIPATGDYNFTIIATDEDDTTMSNTATVLVTVFKPGPKALEFVQSSLSHSVAENSPGETAIGVLQLLAPGLIDPSEYIGNLEFEILSGDNIDYFHIVNSNATLTLLNNFLDRETLATHVILVQAKFKTFQLSTEAYVTIEVNDTNDNAPAFTKGVYAAELPNNSTTGTFVTVISANDDDIGDNAVITYSILGNVTDFVVDSESGSVSTAVALTPGTNHKITVVATDQGVPQLSSTAIVSVVVAQAAPDSISFQSSSYEFSFFENNDPGSHVGTVSISEDVSLLEGLVYEFITPSDPQHEENLDSFHLDAITGSITALFSIDREDFKEVEVSVRATVPEQSSLTDTASITITILDENDYTPTFKKSLYQVGDLTAGSISTSDTIVTVEASDNDNGENGTISYQLVDEVDFNIDSSSGNINVADKDIEAGTYKLTVTATDGGTIPLTGTAVVLVTINVPSVDLAFEYNTFEFDVPENTPIGSVLSGFTLGLKPVNLDYISVLQYKTDDSSFILIGNGTHPDLYSTIDFDYEGPDTEYKFMITATAEMESGDTVTATSSVTVNVLNINDNAPQFTDVPAEGYFQAEIVEGSSPYTEVIGPLAVTDLDGDSIKYALVDTFSGKFIAYGATIITGAEIDREETPLFMLTVEAIDDSDPPYHTSSVSVVVTVIDINDNSPSLLSGNVYYALEEVPSGTKLFTVIATDPDEGVNGMIQYSLEETDYFEINTTSGEVYSKMKLDYEDTSQQKDFKLTLTLRDGGSDIQMIEENITIHVLNVLNDNKPKIANIYKPITVLAKATNGTFITHINAVDYDNDVLKYSLDEPLFAIDSHGNITKANDTELTTGTISVIVTVTDDSIYELSSSIEITIIVVDSIPVVMSSTSSTRTPTHSITRSTTSTPAATESTKVSEPPDTGGGSEIIGFAIAAVFGVLFVLSVITIVIILVLTAGKRRERIKSKSQDPNDAAEENWILKDTNGEGKKDKKSKKKKTKGKQESTELERQNSLVDSSAYETMNEDETALMDLLPVPWGSGSNDHHYQADSEDNPSGAIKSSKKTSAKQPSKLTTPGSKTTPTKPIGNISKPTSITKPGTKAPPALNKPSTTVTRPTSKGSTTPLNKPTSTSTAATRPTAGQTKPKSTPTKASTPQKKPAVGKATTPSKKPPSSATSKRSSNSSDPEGDGKSSPAKRRSRKQRTSIDSTASEFNTEDYLGKYGSGAPMARGERPSEYDIFLKPGDSDKPPPGTRPSLDNLGWK